MHPPLRDPARDLAITGLGAITPLGLGVRAFTGGLRRGISGIGLLPTDDPRLNDPRMKSCVAARCLDFDPTTVLAPAQIDRVPRLIPMALAAAREALLHARLAVDASDVAASRRVGLILGSGGGGIDFTLDQAAEGYAGRRVSLWTITNATHGNLAGELSIALGLRGPSWCVSTGCASSSDALGLAMETLRSSRPGTPDAILVVGADAHIRWEVLSSMELLGVVSTRQVRAEPHLAPTVARPFDASRDGFVLGEGAWAMLLERPAFAQARGVPPLGHALGYGSTCDAFHRVRPQPTMDECVRAIRDALDDAHLPPEAVGVIHYHGTATKLNDAQESLAVAQAFGTHAANLRGSSIKGAIGHPQGASGLASAVATLAALKGLDDGPAFIPPTINLHTPDPQCPLDYTPRLPAPPPPGPAGRTALINCLAFGAKNSALVLSAAST